MNYQVIENFLPEDYFESIYNFLVNSPSPMEWRYTEDVGVPGDKSAILFWKGIYPFDGPMLGNEFFKIMVPILFYSKIYNPLRIRCNCFIKQSESIKTTPHIDIKEPHKVFLYSINSNNGYTILDPNGENIKIPSVANQAVFFDGNFFHQAVTQTDTNIRVNININYI